MRSILFVLVAWVPVALAQTLVDPTQPPPVFAAPAGVTASAPADGGLRLQSVLLPRGGKPVAVIGGQTVRLGETFGSARLVAVTEREVVLKGPDGVQRLFLTPGVEKTGTGAEKQGKRSAKKKEMS